MRIKMKIEMSGSRNGRAWPRPGKVLDVPDSEGASLCASGIATPVAEPEPVERAVVPEPEKRAEPPKRKPRQNG